MDPATWLALGSLIAVIGVALLNARTAGMLREQNVRIELVKCETDKAIAELRAEILEREIERLKGDRT